MEPHHPGRPGPFLTAPCHPAWAVPQAPAAADRLPAVATPRTSSRTGGRQSPPRQVAFEGRLLRLRQRRDPVGDRRERVHPGHPRDAADQHERIYANPNQEFASGGIFNPRTRVYFEGNLTRPFNYEFSFQETYDTLNLLDSYVNYRFSDGFQLRFGRYKTPFTYEWYRVHIWHLLAPERSLFATNFEGIPYAAISETSSNC